MDATQRGILSAEVVQLSNILDQLPPDDWMTRPSFETRMKRIKTELEAVSDESKRIEVWLNFDGDPVTQAKGGVPLPFSNNVLPLFQRAVEYVGASCTGGLSSSGPPADRGNYTLAIMDTAPGSFRFRLEDTNEQEAPDGIEKPMAIAIGRFKELLDSSLVKEEIYVDAVSDLHWRALDAVGEFLKGVAESGAVCGLEYQGEKFAFGSVDDVALAAGRMRAEGVKDVDTAIVGRIMGYLPDSRRIEINVMDPGNHVSLPKGAVMRAAVVAGLDDRFVFKRNLDVDVYVDLSVRSFAGRRFSYRVTECRLVEGSQAECA